MSTYNPARLLDPDTDVDLIPQLAQLHHDSILHDHFMASFLPPLHVPDIVAYWEAWLGDVKNGLRDIIVQTLSHGDSEELVGMVSLWRPVSGTGPFRSEVHKLCTSSQHRGKGIARTLMAKLEEVALSHDRWLVMLDTTIGSGAEYVYPKLGYIQIGVVPNYGFSPKDGTLRDEMFFYKDLRAPGTVTVAPVGSSKQRSAPGSRYAAVE